MVFLIHTERSSGNVMKWSWKVCGTVPNLAWRDFGILLYAEIRFYLAEIRTEVYQSTPTFRMPLLQSSETCLATPYFSYCRRRLSFFVWDFMCMFCSIYSFFIVSAGTLRLSSLRFFHAFSAVVRQRLGYNSRRRGTARTLPNQVVTVLLLIVFFYCWLCCSCS